MRGVRFPKSPRRITVVSGYGRLGILHGNKRNAPLERIYLVGFMGAGKTTVGEILARQLDFQFADLDRMIETQEGTTITQIFAHEGEEEFRRLEQIYLLKTAKLQDTVISTGGGTMTLKQNQAIITASGLSFWLAPSFELLSARLSTKERSLRPLFQDPRQARWLFEQRQQDYQKADVKIDMSAEETAEEVAARIMLCIRGGNCDI